jgi:hypothetical protein
MGCLTSPVLAGNDVSNMRDHVCVIELHDATRATGIRHREGDFFISPAVPCRKII